MISLRDGRYALFEMKMGAGEIDSGAKSLLKLAGKVDSSVMGSPSFCCVIVPGGYAYRRSDGVFVVPITCMCA